MKIIEYKDFKDYKRSAADMDKKIIDTVSEIIGNVRANGDCALIEYAKKFDRVESESFSIEVTEKEKETALRFVEREQSEILECFLNAAENIRAYHNKQKEESWFYSKDKNLYGQLIKPLESVGVYVPGGKAIYPSTVLMDLIPASVAGVKEIVLSSPPDINGEVNPFIIALGVMLGAGKIIKAGGAQAIAALAFGTETVRPVSKIVGPGNAYVASAKRLVMGYVGIDSIAGPSEVVIFADDSANPELIAVDMCAQAEHDADTTAILIAMSETLIPRVQKEIERLIPTLSRREIIEKSFNENAMAIKVNSIEEGFNIINRLAPEHAEFQLSIDTKEILEKTQNAGALFIGRWTPVAAGDYYAGTNHVLPTYGTALFSSPLGVYDFVKRSSFLSLSEGYINEKGSEIDKMARFEKLDAHALSVTIRMKNKFSIS